MKNIVILGASGFVGNELINMCINHPKINIIGLSANMSAGEKINFDQIKEQNNTELFYQKIDEIDFSNVDFIFNCLPNEQLHKIIRKFPNYVRVIDLSIDFRLNAEQDYLDWYNFEHDNLKLVEDFKYGLTELNRSQIKRSKHIANPGCYATSVLIPLTILVEQQAIRTDNIIIDAKSGFSGAGKTKDKEQLLREVYENIKTYGVGDHKHIAEINQELTIHNKKEKVEVFFSANLIPVERGILSNIYINPINLSANEIHNILSNRFKDEAFIEIFPLNEIPSTKEVVGTNKLIIGVKKGYKSDTICIVSALDNLVKGAAGQAMQNFNIMNMIDEKTALR
tara:strand:+ start:357 stop:1373 length:1017 start_codon:yes stop_codon:yes gene_type:complete